MPQISVGADFNEAIAQTIALNNVLNQQGLRLAEVTSQMNTYNALGKITRSVTQGLTEDGKKFVAVLKEQKELVKAASGNSPAIYKNTFLPEKISYTETKKDLDEVTVKAGLLEKGLNRIGKALLYFVTYRAFNFITKEIEDSVAAANKLQIKLSLIRTISQDDQTPTSILQKQVLASSNRSGFSANDTATAFYDAVSNQVAKGGDKVKQFVDTASDLARVTGSTLPDAGNTLTSVINAYGKSASDADRISAILFRTVDEGRIVLSETAGTLGRAAVLGNSLGVSFEELAATLAITTQKGFKTADAMTLITNLLVKLEKPTEETKKLFDSLGVASGEEAIRVFGFTGVLQKMVDLTKAGIVPVSAFFDEIRGRKQFAVFEQSIGDIDKFKNKLQDINGTTAQFNNAVDIRGESPADSVNKKLNAISNSFTSGIGTSIISISDSLLKFGDSALTAAKNSAFLSENATELKISAVSLGAALIILNLQGTKLSSTITLVGKNFISTIPGILHWTLVIVAAIEAARLGIIAGNYLSEKIGGAAASQATEDQKARFEENVKAQRQAESAAGARPSGVGVQEFVATESYRQALGLVAQLSIGNNKLFDDIKIRSREAAESLKVGFAAFGDVLNKRISDLKKKITEAREEIERSTKSSLRFSDSIAAAKFEFQEKYAESTIGGLNSQAINLAKQRVIDLEKEIDNLYGRGDKESIQEARRLQEPWVAAIKKVEELKQAELGRQFAANPDPLGRDISQDSTGHNVRIRSVFTDDYFSALDRAEARIKAYEAKVQETANTTIKTTKKQVEAETERDRRYKDAAQAYAELAPTDADGKVKKEFQDEHGNLSLSKYNAEEARRRKAVQDQIFSGVDKDKIDNTGDDYRIKAAGVLADYQKSRILELGALERQVFFDNLRAKIQASENQYKEDIKRIQKVREEASTKQVKGGEALNDALAFGGDLLNSQRQALQPLNPITGKRIDTQISDTAHVLLDSSDARRKAALDAVATLRKNQTRDDKGGIVTRPEDYLAAKDAVQRFTDSLRALYALQKSEGHGNGLPSVGDKTFNDLDNSLEKGLRDIAIGSGQVGDANSTENILNKQLATKVTDPLLNLQRQFPDLAEAAKKAAESVSTAFTGVVNPGIDSSIQKIGEFQKALEKLKVPGAPGGIPKGAVSSAAGDTGDALAALIGDSPTYAASGGIVGLFPGQPRGVDRYPIWAAAGETIVDAQASRMYRPMLEAIMQRRMPRYMAGGGVVGSSTTVGDINVTVNGATTNEDTGRSVAMRLARESRRRNIKLF